MLSDAVVRFSSARSWPRGRTNFILQSEVLSISGQEFTQFCSNTTVADGGVEAGSPELCALQNRYPESYQVDHFHLTISEKLRCGSF